MVQDTGFGAGKGLRVRARTALGRLGLAVCSASVLLAVVLSVSCTMSTVEKADTCLGLGDYEMAIDLYSAELRRSPGSFEARLGLGKAFVQQAVDLGNDTPAWRRGLMNLEAARTIAGGDQVTRLLSQAWTAHARAMLDKSDTVEALASISRAIEYDPNDVGPLNLAGIVYFRLGEVGKAEALFCKAAGIDTVRATAEFNLGMLRWHGGDLPGARDHWLRALKRSPNDEDILYWFARAEKAIREGGAQ